MDIVHIHTAVAKWENVPQKQSVLNHHHNVHLMDNVHIHTAVAKGEDARDKKTVQFNHQGAHDSRIVEAMNVV